MIQKIILNTNVINRPVRSTLSAVKNNLKILPGSSMSN